MRLIIMDVIMVVCWLNQADRQKAIFHSNTRYVI